MPLGPSVVGGSTLAHSWPGVACTYLRFWRKTAMMMRTMVIVVVVGWWCHLDPERGLCV